MSGRFFALSHGVVSPLPVAALLLLALFVGSGWAPPARASITGVCPDGSIFIVQRAEAIPCREAKTVDPSDVPPIRPEYLPRPYGWEVHNRKNDPNNPYNLIVTPLISESPTPSVRAAPQATGPDREASGDPAIVPEQVIASRPPFRSEPEGLDLGLAEVQLRDLGLIVELSQRDAPAAILARGSGGRVRLARSAAFEARMQDELAARGRATGSVLLFSVDAAAEGEGAFYGNLTFVQEGMAYTPSSDDPLQLGTIRGQLGTLTVDEPVLGYVVLPGRLDLSRPMDIYWNDRQVTATLQP